MPALPEAVGWCSGRRNRLIGRLLTQETPHLGSISFSIVGRRWPT
jgi:hypothetical protein